MTEVECYTHIAMGTLIDPELTWGRADFLFSEPSILSGSATALDLGGTLFYFNSSSSPEAADRWALLQDWYCVGDALRASALREQPEQVA